MLVHQSVNLSELSVLAIPTQIYFVSCIYQGKCICSSYGDFKTKMKSKKHTKKFERVCSFMSFFWNK